LAGIVRFPATPGIRGFPNWNGKGPTHMHRPLTACSSGAAGLELPFLLALLFLALLLVGVLFLVVRLACSRLGVSTGRLRL
jgi:flagellar biogenesis protein FliO